MTQPDLARLEGLSTRASPRPWLIHSEPDVNYPPTIHAVTSEAIYGNHGPIEPLSSDDQELIVAAVNSLPALLARVRELEKENVRLALLAANGAPVLQQHNTEEQDALVDFIRSLRTPSPSTGAEPMPMDETRVTPPAVVRYAAIGETSTEGARWYIWKSGDGSNYVGGKIADHASAKAIADELNRLSPTLHPADREEEVAGEVYEALESAQNYVRCYKETNTHGHGEADDLVEEIDRLLSLSPARAAILALSGSLAPAESPPSTEKGETK